MVREENGVRSHFSSHSESPLTFTSHFLVTQLSSAPALGAGYRRFKPSRPGECNDIRQHFPACSWLAPLIVISVISAALRRFNRLTSYSGSV